LERAKEMNKEIKWEWWKKEGDYWVSHAVTNKTMMQGVTYIIDKSIAILTSSIHV
jgi:hypothetical protein